MLNYGTRNTNSITLQVTVVIILVIQFWIIILWKIKNETLNPIQKSHQTYNGKRKDKNTEVRNIPKNGGREEWILFNNEEVSQRITCISKRMVLVNETFWAYGSCWLLRKCVSKHTVKMIKLLNVEELQGIVM